MTLARFVRRAAMSAASANAVGPSYIPALATGRPMRWLTMVWNSNATCNDPCATSGWYGVYEVMNSPRFATFRATAGT